MEDALTKIVKEAQLLKLSNITAACYSAQEIICDKSSLLKWPMHEIRYKCLGVFEECLQPSKGSNYQKLQSLAISGLQSMIRDRLYWTVDSEEAAHQLPLQMCQCIGSIINGHNEKIQLELFSLLTEMSSTVTSLITIEAVEEVIIICSGVHSHGSVSPKLQLAMEVATNQICHHYCCNVITNDVDETIIFNEDLFPLLSFLCDHHNQIFDNSIHINASPMILKCVHCIFISIPNQSSVINESFVNFIWQTLCPLLVKLLSNDSIKKLINPKSHDVQSVSSDHIKQIGRGSESISKLEQNNNKYIYSIASELVRLFGEISSLRPVLESLYHRMLLYPPVSDRLDALKFIHEFLKHSDLIVKLSSQPIERFGKVSRSKDLDLVHIIIDSLEECSSSSDDSIVSLSISCAVSLLSSFEMICAGNGLSDDTAKQINSKYACVENADFEGFDMRSDKDLNDKEEVVNYEMLRNRIRGHGDGEESTECPNDEQFVETAHEADEDFEKKNKESKDMKNFQMNTYKTKLSAILKSGSSESAESQETDAPINDENVTDHVKEEVNKDEEKEINNEPNDCTDDEYDTASCNSGVTEGPEEDNEEPSSDNYLSDIVVQLQRREEQEWFHTICESDSDTISNERENARNLIKALKKYLPTLLPLRSSIEADESIQFFASNYCKELWLKHNISHLTIVNADGIYLSIYSALLLNLKLLHVNYYHDSSTSKIPLTEAQFIERVYSNGVLVYISATFLAEIYQQILACDILTESGYDCHSHDTVALINLLTDIDGLDSCEPGAQQLSDYRRLERASLGHRRDFNTCEDAGRKLIRRLLTAFWDPLIQVLASAFGTHSNKRDILTLSLDGMQMASKLCIQLGLQAKCGTLFGLLSLASSPSSPPSSFLNQTKRAKSARTKRLIESLRNISMMTNKTLPFHTSHLLSMHVILNSSLEIGSHCPQCWRHVFQCCLTIMTMERSYFSGRSTRSLSSLTSFSSLLMAKSGIKQPDDDLNLSTINEIDNMPGIGPMNGDPSESLDKCIHECITNSSSNDGIIRGKKLETAIDLLSQMVDRLFDDAAQKLNLHSLSGFLNELCTSSREQILLLKQSSSSNGNNDNNKTISESVSVKCLLITRLSDVLLRCAKSGRPLMHMMKCWSIVTPHLVEAIAIANSIGPNHLQMQCVASKSVSTLHDIMGVSLTLHTELSHFHFNESLFKPFETVMLLELCDTDIQELIISSMCEFVEGTTDEIRSGWRSLFGALRAIRLPSDSEELERVRQLRVILDIFEAFLHTDNLQVFANAALDCLLCLLRLVKDNNRNVTDQSQHADLCLVGLKYLHQFCSLLASMYQMPACPLFTTGKRLQSSAADAKTIEIPQFICSDDNFSLSIDVSLDQLDRPVKILNVWFMLIDGIAQTIETCPSQHKSQTIELLFHMLKALVDIPGFNFAIYCVNHILLPSLQRWLKSCYTIDYTADSVATVKHCAGLTADLVVEYIKMLPVNDPKEESSQNNIFGIDLLLQQSLLIFVECIAFTSECHHSLVRLSCACIRHILLTGWTHFNSKHWSIVCFSLTHVHKITLSSISSLVSAFNNTSTNFFSDLDLIKVISKRNTIDCDAEQLCQIAQRVFLLDAQRCELQNDTASKDTFNNTLVSLGDDRSFTLLIENERKETITVSFRDLVIQLSTHYYFLQTITALLLNHNCYSMPSISTHFQQFCPSQVSSSQLNSLLAMEKSHINNLLSLINETQRVSSEFDDRPGLKFLMQKLCRARVPANLYQLSSMSWCGSFLVNFTIANDPRFNCFDIVSYKEELGHSLTSLCDHYCEWITKSASKSNNGHIWLDDLSERPLFLLLSSNPCIEGDEELANIIGTSNGSVLSSSNETKTYKLASEQTIESVMSQYKRWKAQHSPLPPAPDGTSSKRSIDGSDDRSISDAEKENTEMLIKDIDARLTLWSELIHEVIDLHLSLSIGSDVFNSLVPTFLPAIETLIIYCNNRKLRECLSQWMSRIANIMIEHIKS